ncbi:unnamed protein product [Ectocarpus sp. 8 AP-2014]
MIFFKHIWFLSRHLAGSSHCCCTKGAHAHQLHASSIAAPVSAERTDWQCERWPCSPRRVCVCVRRFHSSAITNHYDASRFVLSVVIFSLIPTAKNGDPDGSDVHPHENRVVDSITRCILFRTRAA